MNLYEISYFSVVILNIFLAITIIFLERRNISSTWAWIMVLFFIPVFGFILYLILGQKFKKRKLSKLIGVNTNLVEQMLIEHQLKLQTGALLANDKEASQYSDLILMNLNTNYSMFTNENDLQIFTDGYDKFESLIQDIKAAKHHIHLEYYIFRNDSTGKRLMSALTEKAKQGVEVRFIYDHIGSVNLTRKFFKEFELAGGRVEAFFKSKIPYLNLKINYRNHRKLVVIDGQIGYLGGFNIGDEYLGLNKRFGYWRDTHLRIQGRSVQQMQVQFMLDWNLLSSVKLAIADNYFPAVFHETKDQIGIQVVASGPDSDFQEIKNSYIKMIYGAKQSIFLQTPYFVPDSVLLSALQTAALSGKDVRIMLPYKRDHFFVYWATQSYISDLLEYGIKVYLYKEGFLHAKTLVVDGKIASVGTTNLDIRSFKLNFEMNAFIYSERVATELSACFVKDMDGCELMTMEIYNNRPMFNRFRESISRLLSPIL